MGNHDVRGPRTTRNVFNRLPKKDAEKSVLEIQRRAFVQAASLYPDSDILKSACGFKKVKLPLDKYLPVDCDRLFIEYGLTRLLSKCAIAADRKACKAKALETSLAAERQCSQTNSMFQKYQRGDFSFLPRIAWCLSDAKSELRRLFGTITEQDVLRNAAFGPGVSLGHRGLQPTKVDKLAMNVTGTPYALKLWATEFPYFTLLTPGLLQQRLSSDEEGRHLKGGALVEPQVMSVVNYDEWTNVAKDRDTDRGICVSPTANVRYQKGLGAEMRRKLKSWGLDLSRQAGVNAELARKGSLGEGFDTIDLKSASDTVACEPVRYLFEGTDVLRMMEGLRTPVTVYPTDDGPKWVTLQKFSAMGNGFTFELETAIYAAVVRAANRYLGLGDFATDHTWSVFGDDICCRSEVTPLVLELLDVLGFIVNEDKSFTSGYFRESCGKDWFCGVQVRPYFFKADHLSDITYTRLANGFRRWCCRSLGGPELGLLDGRFRGVWRYIVKQVERPLPGYTYESDSFLMVSNNDLDMPHSRRRLDGGLHKVYLKGYGCKTRGLVGLYPDETLYAFLMHFGRSLPDSLTSFLEQAVEYADRFQRVPCKGDTLSQRWIF